MSVQQFLQVAIRECAENLSIPPSDVDYSQLTAYLKEINEGMSNDEKREMKVMGGFNAIKTAHYPKTFDAVTDADLKKHRIRQLAKANEAEAKDNIFNKSLAQTLDSLLSKHLSGKITPSGYAVKTSHPNIKREVNICLSDLHFGDFMDPAKGLMQYGQTEAARRLAKVVKQVIEYKAQYRHETSLRVHLLGDIIHGKLHDPQASDELSHQMVMAMHLLTQAIATFAKNFPTVTVHCVSGNHGRNPMRHPKHATYDKYDSYETVVYHGLKLAASNLKNVTFDIPKSPYVTFNSFDARVFGTHGDTVFNVGRMWDMINASSLEQQINRINAAQPKQKEFKLFFVGHIHMGSLVHLQNQVKLITNGALVPSDEYSRSIGMFESTCGQTMWESTPGHVVGDYRFIEVNDADTDSSLDAIIRPFTGL